jgi:hypothetical protein
MFRVSFLAGMILAIACATGDAKAAQIYIVALGASNTAGFGVGTPGAYPAYSSRCCGREAMKPMLVTPESVGILPLGCCRGLTLRCLPARSS